MTFLQPDKCPSNTPAKMHVHTCNCVTLSDPYESLDLAESGPEFDMRKTLSIGTEAIELYTRTVSGTLGILHLRLECKGSFRENSDSRERLVVTVGRMEMQEIDTICKRLEGGMKVC